MKYVSLDLETSGLNPHTSQILGISMVVEDTENRLPLEQLPHFTRIIRYSSITGTPIALSMNDWILRAMVSTETPPDPVFYEADVMTQAHLFLNDHFGSDRITLAGKNVGIFDYQFLPSDLQRRFAHRIIDVGSVMIDWTQPRPPSLDDLKKRYNMGTVTHDMYRDALDVISILRRTY